MRNESPEAKLAFIDITSSCASQLPLRQIPQDSMRSFADFERGLRPPVAFSRRSIEDLKWPGIVYRQVRRGSPHLWPLSCRTYTNPRCRRDLLVAEPVAAKVGALLVEEECRYEPGTKGISQDDVRTARAMKRSTGAGYRRCICYACTVGLDDV